MIKMKNWRRKGMKNNKNRLPLFLTVLLLGFLYYNPALFAGEIEMSKYIAENSYFEIEVPESWTILPIDHLGEVSYIFTPEKVNREEVESGQALQTVLIVKFNRLTKEEGDLPPAELLDKIADYRLNIFEQYGLDFSKGETNEETISHLTGYSTTLTSPDELYYLFVAKENYLMYEVTYSYEYSQEEEYADILKSMVKSINYLGIRGINHLGPEKESFINFVENQYDNIKLLHPYNWFAYVDEEGDILNLLISKEELKDFADENFIGVSILKIDNFPSYTDYNLVSDVDILQAVYSSIINETEGQLRKMFVFEPVLFLDKKGVIFELSYEKENYFVQQIHLIFADNNTCYHVLFEAPISLFELYREVFGTIFESIQV